MKLLNKVLEIEASGGLKTGNGLRRRTAGGVFFHLIKTDTIISKDQKEVIFGLEETLAAERRKVTKKQKVKCKYILAERGVPFVVGIRLQDFACNGQKR